AVSCCPVWWATVDSQKFSRPHSLFSCVVLIQVGSLQANDPNVVGMSVHASVVAGDELDKVSMGSLIGVSPQSGHRHFCCGTHALVIRLLGGAKYHLFSAALTLHPPDGPSDHYRRCNYNQP